MSWSQRMLDATFRGLPIEILQVGDEGGHALAQHEYPYQDGGDVHDMGARVRQVKLRAIFRGADYEAALENFLLALRQRGAGELVHPVFGPLQVKVATWSVDHSGEMVDGALVSVTFLEAGVLQPVFSRAVVDRADVVTAEAGAAREICARGLQRQVNVAGMDNPLQRLAGLKSALQGAMGRLKAALNFSALRAILSDLDPLLYPKAWAHDFMAIIDRAFQGLPFGGLNERYDPAAGAVVVAVAAQLLQQPRLTDFYALQQALSPEAIDLPAAQATVGLQAAPDDAAALLAFVRVACACTVAEAAAMVLVAELEDKVLSIADMERLAAAARVQLQGAIDAVRDGLPADESGPLVQALKRQAVSVQELALDAIRLRPPLVTRQAPVGGHWRLVAHALHGDSSRAPELARLNSWGRRLFVGVRENVKAYAR